MKKPKSSAPAPVDRAALIESLALPIKYSQAQRVVDQLMAIAPYAPDELQRMVVIAEGEGTRWEPPRITFYQHLLEGLSNRPDTPLAGRLTKLLQRARADLISRLARSNNYPTARMYLDALQRFSHFTPAQVERIVAVKSENKRIAAMRLEPRQFLFYRELLAGYGSQISTKSAAQLVGLLKTAVEDNPELAQA